MTEATKSHFGTSWQDQHERVGRWHKRLSAIRRGIPPDMSQAEALDVVYAFFMNCYHLRDWIINSGFKPKAEVDGFIRGHPDLKLCGDICNGLKHFRVDPKKAWASSTWSTASVTTFSFPPGTHEAGPIPGVQWVFTVDGTEIDMFDLAGRCVAAWDRFLVGA
jgi:hypothetical protein